ncbi:Uma2 family endonuclease [Tundrisphaera lichenicola]|uniref:Uma2 family endonuclease n=1 Tax=Tundrisphaera lichenicola TaxID=2029860 RepID=UPI003EC0CA68
MATVTPARSTIPVGATLHNVAWATYCKLRDEPANDHVRMTYLDGELTIVSPHLVHDYDSRRIMLVVLAVSRAYRIRCMVVGTTTLRKKGRGPIQGAAKEPDEGFYLGEDVARIRGKQVLDLTIDPPPTLALEVDHSANSEAALPTYPRIGVPEVWRLDVKEQSLWFGRLAGDHYEEIDRSPSLPRLTPALVLQALEARMQQPDDIEWLDWLDQWARDLPEAD